MKAIYLLLALCIYCNSSISFSQEYAFGLKGGLNTNSIGDINSRGGSIAAGKADELFSPKQDIGYLIGGYFMIEFKRFFIRPELNYVDLQNHYDFPRRKSKWTTSKFEIPLLVGYEIVKPVSVYAGPNFNFFDEIQLEGVQVTSYSDGGPDIDRNTVGLNIGVMVRYNRFNIDLRYEMGTKQTEEELLDINNGAFGVNLADLRAYTPSTLSLSLSIDIFRTDGKSISDLFKNDGNCGCPYK
ncbi:outer membrane beta-barrel protein [Aestuariivivens sediminicola]|uniref:outer membrane beta-barrel protein n=1 Tax=Aestuariivivens sediminicola TaxID=2913560 RepID=UPI001F5AED46|nr:outer membrane beta-barrel protein [Aestuariivivens sediminicola]